MAEARNGAAFFDLDRTLIAGSSAFVFGHAAWSHGMMPTRDLLSDAMKAIQFRFSGASDEKANAVRDRILESIKGRTIDELMALGGDIIPRLLDDVRKESQGFIDLHTAAGRDTYMVTASPIEIVQTLSEELGMTGAIATVAETVDGVYTGELSEPFCYGPAKADAIRRMAARRGYDLALSYAYSDSVSDLPMLEAVGHPVAVNPDSGLEAVARARGWPIVEFSRTARRVIRTTTASAGAVGLAITTYVLGRRHGRRAASLH
ncbi:MAG: HAD-IB family hydrolase [Acidimicrobiia bacterium]|nr:HAD-IB family hydrolase [Acidimicrobiia bacterium]